MILRFNFLSTSKAYKDDRSIAIGIIYDANFGLSWFKCPSLCISHHPAWRPSLHAGIDLLAHRRHVILYFVSERNKYHKNRGDLWDQFWYRVYGHRDNFCIAIYILFIRCKEKSFFVMKPFFFSLVKQQIQWS